MILFKKGFALLVIALSMYAASAQTPDSRGFIVKEGDYVSDIKFDLVDEGEVLLSDFIGQVVMLQFTASWCHVCREEMPHIENEIWQEFKDQGLVVIGVDLKEKENVIRKFKKQIGITYPLATDFDGEIFSQFASLKSGVTRNILIDKTGKIIFLTRLFDKDEFNNLILTISNELNDTSSE